MLRRHTIGGVLRDTHGARGRARAVRDILRADPTATAVLDALAAGLQADAAQIPL